MPLTKGDEYKLLHLLLYMGEMMLCCGGEVRRVENMLSLIGKAYGATETNVFVINSSIVIMMKFSDGNLITESRRVNGSTSNKLWQLEELNAISRKLCENPITLNEFENQLKKCDRPTKPYRLYIGSALAAGAFAIFFGGNLLDGVAASIFALLIGLFQSKLYKFFPNNIIFNVVCSFLVGVIICLSAKFIPFIDRDMTTIGVIMLLIPGVSFTNSIRDLIVGDTISGIMRLIESLICSAGLAIGFMLAIFLTGGVGI